jgi:predicted nucleic acid-binding protein
MTMMGVTSLFVDTNILIYSTSGVSPWRVQAIQMLETVRQSGVEIILSTQILREYLATATRLNAQGIGLPLVDILANLQTFQTQFRIVEDNQAVFNTLTILAQNFQMAGRQVYDANIVATMQAYGITHLLTHNTADFIRYSGIITVVPLIPSTP